MIVVVKKEIRRALEIPLNIACKAQVPPVPILWTTPVDRASVPQFLSVEMIWGPVEVLEIGKTPRFQGNGALSIVVRTPVQLGRDGNDALAKIVALAYPYGEDRVFEGVTVNIDKIESGPYVNDGAWVAGVVTVDWTCYRR